MEISFIISYNSTTSPPHWFSNDSFRQSKRVFFFRSSSKHWTFPTEHIKLQSIILWLIVSSLWSLMRSFCVPWESPVLDEGPELSASNSSMTSNWHSESNRVQLGVWWEHFVNYRRFFKEKKWYKGGHISWSQVFWMSNNFSGSLIKGFLSSFLQAKMVKTLVTEIYF